MSRTKNKSWLAMTGALVVAGAVGAGWWLGSDRPLAPLVQPHATESAASSENTSSTAAPPSVVTVGQPDPFAALSCRARQYQGGMAMAVTFSQPVDRKADLSKFIQIIDQGVGQSNEPQTGESAVKPLGAAPSVAAAGRPANGAWVVGDNPRVVFFPYIQPQRSYLIKLESGLPGQQAGATLGAAGYCEVQTQAMSPAFYFASRGVVLPTGQNGGLPVATVNVPEVDVQFLRVAPERIPEFFDSVLRVGGSNNARGSSDDDDPWEYSSNRDLKGLVDSWTLDKLNPVVQSVFQGRFVTDDRPNRRQVTFLPIETIKELQEPGIYVAVMSEPGRFRYEYQVTYFYVSDIGLHARRYADHIAAYAVSLKGGQAIAGVTVELVGRNGKVISKAVADDQGHVRFDGDYAKASLIRAVRGKEMTVMALAEPALDLSEFDIGGHPSRSNSVFVYAGRNLYRPGETFTVSVLPRDAGGRLLQPSPLTATVKRPDGRVVQTALWQPRKEIPGYFEQSIDLPQDAQTGAWMLELRVDPAARVADASWKFQVEEFMPERMKLKLDSEQTVLFPGQELSVSVQGDYLYGAPAAGNRLLTTFFVKRERYALAQQWPGFVFGDVADDAHRHYEEMPPAVLDSQGRAQLKVNPALDGSTHSPMQLRLSASLLESGGRPVVRSIERSIWPADRLIAVRPLFDRDVAPENASASFELIRVNQQGEAVPLAQAAMRLFREDRQYYWRFDDQRGWNSGFTDIDELMDSRMLEIRERTLLTASVTWGRYRLEVTDPDTGLTMRYRFYAGWNAQDADAVGNRPDHVQLQLHGAPAKLGAAVRVNVKPPHDGQALITVEGDRQLWSKWVAVKASGTEVDIPVDKSWLRHDLYIAAVVFRPGSEGDRVTPARALGLTFLPIDSSERKLQVQLTAVAKTESETTPTVRIKVDGLQSKQAWVTLSAVDVGILNINQYPTPDPADFFFGKHRYAPELLDMYGKLIEKMEGGKGRLKWGGDAGMRGDSNSLPKKVKLVDLFAGAVKLNDKGEAEIALPLPDFNGTLRLMAVAFEAENYGSAEAEMVVAAPIVAELNTPRFITPGDRAAIALDVTNLSGAAQTIHIKLEALDPLAIADGARVITLKNKERATLRFAASATGSYGPGLIRLSVQGNGGDKPVNIVRESVLPVQPAQAPDRQVLRMRLSPGETLNTKAEWVAAHFPDSATVSMSLSNRPPFNVHRFVDELLNYPYGCTEQTISAAMPWVMINEDEAKRFGLKPHTLQERQIKAAAAMGKLAGMQGAAGSFSLWGAVSNSPGDLWLTAYALSFMQDARDQGFAVPEVMLNRSRDELLKQLQQQTASGFGSWSQSLQSAVAANRIQTADLTVLRDDHRRFAALAASGLALARDGKAPLSTLRQLFDNYQERARSPLPLVQLAAAFKLLGDEKRMQQALDLAMRRDYGISPASGNDYEEWLGDYGSSVRDYALAYALLNRYELRHERSELLLTQLASRLNQRSYFSTQEQMALLRAASVADPGGGTWQAALSVAGERQVLQNNTDRTITLDPTRLAATQISNIGAKALYAEFDIQGTTMTPPAERSDMIVLKKGWYHPDGRAWNGSVLQTGDMLVVWAQASANTNMPEALLVDRVPAGFEVENLNLSQGPDMQDWSIGGRRVAEAMSSSAIKHIEFRDDRYVAALALGKNPVNVFYLLRVVTPGMYAVPSIEAEDMYRAELRGVGKKWGIVEIRDRGIPR